jgi:hypothetical protein
MFFADQLLTKDKGHVDKPIIHSGIKTDISVLPGKVR